MVAILQTKNMARMSRKRIFPSGRKRSGRPKRAVAAQRRTMGQRSGTCQRRPGSKCLLQYPSYPNWSDSCKRSEEEKQATDEKKQEESKEGKQFVGNTQTAKDARRKANKDGSDDLESRKQEQTRGTSGTSGTKGKATDADEQEYDEEDDADAAEEEGYSYEEAEDGDYDEEGADDEEQVYDEDEVEEVDEVDGERDGQKDDDEEVAHEDEAAPRGQKRGTGKQGGGPSKKQKDNSDKGKKNGTIGSKHDPAEAPAPPGSRDRVPEKGQKVVWRALPGYVDGEVVEILYSQKEVDGKQVKAKKDDPRAVLKSSSSGKICVHKLDAIYFDD